MLMKKEPDSQDNTRPDDLNNYKLHLCICEKPIYFVFLQMLSAREAGMLYEKSWAARWSTTYWKALLYALFLAVRNFHISNAIQNNAGVTATGRSIYST